MALWLTLPSITASAAATSASIRFCRVIGKASARSFLLKTRLFSG